MHNWKIAIPSAFTLGNLFCGFIGIILAFKGALTLAFYFMLLGAFLDFWDGLLARKLKVDGELGKQLDSLADMVSFGILPSMIIYHIMLEGGVYIEFLKPIKSYLPFFAGLIALATAWRLAVFNIDSEQTLNFKGLASPASAILIGSVGLSFEMKGFYYPIFWFNEVNMIFVGLMTWLLNSRMDLLSLKFKNYDFKENIFRYLLVLISLLSVIFYSFEAIPIIIMFYIGISFLHFKTRNEI